MKTELRELIRALFISEIKDIIVFISEEDHSFLIYTGQKALEINHKIFHERTSVPVRIISLISKDKDYYDFGEYYLRNRFLELIYEKKFYFSPKDKYEEEKYIAVEVEKKNGITFCFSVIPKNLFNRLNLVTKVI